MHKIKTNELIGPALDWAVAKCEEPVGGYKAWVQADLNKGVLHGMRYSTEWDWGGPIIERECIWLEINEGHCYAHKDGLLYSEGLTPLVAAMRCYAASKLGDEVEIPKELLK